MSRIDTERHTSGKSLQADYALKLQNRFSALGTLPDDVEESWNVIRNNIIETANETIGCRKRRRTPWLSVEADRLITLKREAVTRGDNAERNRLKRAFRSKALEDREAYFNGIAEEAQRALTQNNVRPIYRAIKLICGSGSHEQGTQVAKSNGDKCRTEKEVLSRWVEYYQTALNHPAAAPCPALDDIGNQSADSSTILVDV